MGCPDFSISNLVELHFPSKKNVFNSRFSVDLQITTAGYTKLLNNLQVHPKSKLLVLFDK